MYRVHVGSKYCKTHWSLEDAKDAVVTAGGTLERDRAKRMSTKDFIVKAQKYLDWVVDTGFEPGDLTAATEFRCKRGDIVRGPLPRTSLSSKEKRRRGHGSVKLHTTR